MKNYFVMAALLFFIQSNAHAELWSAFNAGVGLGHATLNGDITRDQRGTVVELGFNVEQEDYLFRLVGRTEDDNRFKGSEFIVGYGNRYFKIGTGLMGIQGSIPSTDTIMTNINGYGLIRVDRNRDTDVSVTTLPLVLSITPYHSKNFKLNLEGYYGLYSRGSLTIPILALGQEAYIHTEPVRQGGAKGVSASMTWGLPSISHHLAVQLRYHYQQAKMNRQRTTFQGDALGNLGVINMPELNLTQETLMLSVIYLIR